MAIASKYKVSETLVVYQGGEGKGSGLQAGLRNGFPLAARFSPDLQGL